VIDEEAEVVDGLPVPAEPSDVEQAPGSAIVPARQAAALAATGFVAGVTTVAVVRGARTRRAARKRKKKGSAIGEIMSSNSFLIDVHLLRRD
jgi:hypothetical protein